MIAHRCAWCWSRGTGTHASCDYGCGEASAFAGERQDGAGGAYYLRARRYDPQTGRFTQPDPIGYAGGGNLYAYATNNPQTYTDPPKWRGPILDQGSGRAIWAVGD